MSSLPVFALLLLVPFAATSFLPAQSPPAYDVATIKPNTTGSGSSGISINDTTYRATNVSIKTLLDTAYDIRPELISGVPSALDSLHFDVDAKIVDPDLKALASVPDGQRRAMILTILKDRFHLVAHTQIRTLPLFELIVVPTGPKFAKTESSPGDYGTSVRNRSLEAHGITMASFAGTLTGQLQKTVVDKTALAGDYDVKLKWSPDDAEPGTSPDPDLYTALQEQLGLKLREAKGPVPTLIVDHIELPTPN